jgi:MscS family membrane protein
MEKLAEFWAYCQAHPTAYHTIVAVLILAAAIPIRWLLKKIILIFQKRVFSRTENDIDDKIAALLAKRITGVTFIVAARFSLREIRRVVSPESERLLDGYEVVSGILYIVTAVLILRILIGVLRITIDSYFENVEHRTDSKQLLTIAPLARKLSVVVLTLIAAAVVMERFSINVGSLLLSLGVGSLAIALAAQDTIANIIAGIIIAIDQPFRVGDRIELSNGKIVDIAVIGLRSTRLKDFDLNYVIMPNAELIKSTIINYAYPTNKTRVLILFQVPYGTDMAAMRNLLLETVNRHRLVTNDPITEVQFIKFAESGIDARVECYVADYTEKFYAEIELRELVEKVLRENGIAINLPQRVVHLAPPESKVELDKIKNNV